MEKKSMMITAVSPPLWTQVWRGVKTIFFVFTMIGSLLLFSAPPLLVAILDIILPTVLLHVYSSDYVPVSVGTIVERLRPFDFKSSLVDVPLISVARSLLILFVYSLCDVPGRSRGPYLGTTLFCSVVSVSYVAVKACVTFDGSMRWRQSPEGSIWQAVIMSSMLLAIAHVVVAYKTNCRERRKLVVFQIDLEAVPFTKTAFDYRKSYIN
ncbi:Alpha/beta hydrolase related protein [Zostera marina]|uniref:Alpha/beta hydrolase related protein n=1 Tax=Zostera marina TaxID=29655 RepID=A0A0K9Q4G1_ZOSMR|nr:Alpha/beta hydrolase related protein [Zostera marina]